MTVNGDSEPIPIQVDRIERGSARLLIRWNINKVSTVDPMNEQIRESWNYEESIIWWVLPEAYPTTQDVIDYLATQESVILGYAQASKMTYGLGEV
jgi:hypothetical protein